MIELSTESFGSGRIGVRLVRAEEIHRVEVIEIPAGRIVSDWVGSRWFG